MTILVYVSRYRFYFDRHMTFFESFDCKVKSSDRWHIDVHYSRKNHRNRKVKTEKIQICLKTGILIYHSSHFVFQPTAPEWMVLVDFAKMCIVFGGDYKSSLEYRESVLKHGLFQECILGLPNWIQLPTHRRSITYTRIWSVNDHKYKTNFCI